MQLVHSELDDDDDDVADSNNSNPLTRSAATIPPRRKVHSDNDLLSEGIHHVRSVHFQHPPKQKSPTTKSLSFPLGTTWSSTDGKIPAARRSSDLAYVLYDFFAHQQTLMGFVEYQAESTVFLMTVMKIN